MEVKKRRWRAAVASLALAILCACRSITARVRVLALLRRTFHLYILANNTNKIGWLQIIPFFYS